MPSESSRRLHGRWERSREHIYGSIHGEWAKWNGIKNINVGQLPGAGDASMNLNGRQRFHKPSGSKSHSFFPDENSSESLVKAFWCSAICLLSIQMARSGVCGEREGNLHSRQKGTSTQVIAQQRVSPRRVYRASGLISALR
ncbi:hypothetical protein MPH_09812, partial [Macrophomina phaseolina MS6]